MIKMNVKGTGFARDNAGRFRRMSGRLRDEMRATMRSVTRYAQQYIRQNKLSGQVLKYGTGKLYNSIYAKVQSSGNTVTGTVGTDVVYGKFWEHGGNIRAHDIYPRFARALHWVSNETGLNVFARRVHKPRRYQTAKPWLKPAMIEMRETIREMMSDMIVTIARVG